jgi:FMN reductase
VRRRPEAFVVSLLAVAVSGSPRTPSRTTALVSAVLRRVALRADVATELVEVAPLVPDLATSAPERRSVPTRRALDLVERADLLVVGSPSFNASYTGAFKMFVDELDPAALRGTPTLLTATGGSERHTLMIEQHLRPLFAFFRALTLPTTVYASARELTATRVTDPALRARVDAAADEAVEALRVRELLAAAAPDAAPGATPAAPHRVVS